MPLLVSLGIGIGCHAAVRKPAPALPPPGPSQSPPGLGGISSGVLPSGLMALLPTGGRAGDPFELRIGPGVPPEFPADLLPAGTDVAATATNSAGVIVVGIARDVTAPRRLQESLRLTSAGWNSTSPARHGFVQSPTDFPISVCRDAAFASLTFADRPEGGSFVRASFTRDPRRLCVSRPDIGNFPDVVIPSLSPPPGGRMTGGGGGGGGGDEMYSRAVIDSSLTAQAVAAHYAAQMEAAGWKIDARATDDGAVSLMRFGTISRIGDSVTAVLTVAAITGTARFDLMLSVVRNMPSRGRPGGGGGRGFARTPARK